jgi:hypothetical protein
LIATLAELTHENSTVFICGPERGETMKIFLSLIEESHLFD